MAAADKLPAGPATDEDRASWLRNPLSLTRVVYLETTGYCPEAGRHRFCPATLLDRAPSHLPLKLVDAVLASLARASYDRQLRFHHIGEPLSAPRLYTIIERSRRALPHAELVLCTNGAALSETLSRELVGAGVDKLFVSVYSDREYRRLRALSFGCKGRVRDRRAFDDDTLIGQYAREPLSCSLPCSAPLGNLMIGRDGALYLCMRDWQRRYVFGSVASRPLEDILSSDVVWRIYAELRSGKRTLDLCQRCSRQR